MHLGNEFRRLQATKLGCEQQQQQQTSGCEIESKYKKQITKLVHRIYQFDEVNIRQWNLQFRSNNFRLKKQIENQLKKKCLYDFIFKLKHLRFALDVYLTFMNYTSIEALDLHSESDQVHVEWNDFSRFDLVHMRFYRHSFWKQINVKIFDLLVSLISAKNIPADLLNILKSNQNYLIKNDFFVL